MSCETNRGKCHVRATGGNAMRDKHGEMSRESNRGKCHVIQTWGNAVHHSMDIEYN